MGYRFGKAQHIGGREQQQDSVGLCHSHDRGAAGQAGLLAIVADGMGGLANGDAASRTAVRAFLRMYRTKTEEESIPDALLRGARAANDAVFALSDSLGQAGEMGTTLLAAVLNGDQIYWISAGDSGLFLFRDGELTQLNVPHVYGLQLDAKAFRGEITEEAALSDPQRESLTSYLGPPEIFDIDVTQNGVALRPDDLILLASDGLFKTLPTRDIEAVLSATGTADVQELSERLIEATIARKRRGQDNVSVIAIAAEGPKPAVASPSSSIVSACCGARRSARPVAIVAVVALALAASAFLGWRLFQ